MTIIFLIYTLILIIYDITVTCLTYNITLTCQTFILVAALCIYFVAYVYFLF